MMAQRKNHPLRRSAFVLGIIIGLIGIASCSTTDGGGGDPTPGPDNIVLDEICQGALNLTFISEESILLGETEDGSPYWGPMMVSFLNDGRALWRYQIDPIFGTFTCEAGIFNAVFSEGELDGFEGQFDPDRTTLSVNGVLYFANTDI